MKKLLTILFSLLIVLFMITALYVLELPPFQRTKTLNQTAENITQQSLPAFLTTQKSGTIQTYEEHMQKAKQLSDNNYPALAIAEYQSANQTSPQNPDPLIQIGRINLRNNEFIKAKQNFEQALAIQPQNTGIKIYLARALLGDRKIAEAQMVLSQISDDNQISLYYKGIIAAFFGDYDNSKKLLKSAANMATNEDITNKANNFLSAFEEFNFNQGANKIHLKTLLGRSFAQCGEYQMAIPLLFEVIKEKKDYRDAWILLGYSYLNLQKYQDAVEALEAGKKLDPQKSETLFYLGLSYFGTNNFNLAATNLELAKKYGYQPVIQIDQKLAEIYLELKNYQQSAQNYENVLALNSSDLNLFTKPVWIYIDQLNQPEKALILGKKAVISHPREAMSYNLLGWALIASNQLDKAENQLQKALALDSNLDAAYLNLGLLNEKKGLMEQAIGFYQKAYQIGHGNSISVRAANNYNNLIGKMDKINYANLKASLINP